MATSRVPQIASKLSADDSSSSSSVLSSVTDLAFDVLPNGIYAFEFFLPFSSPATGTGLVVAVSAPAAPVYLAYTARIPVAADAAANAEFVGWGTAIDDLVVGTGVQAANVVYLAKIEGVLRNGANAGVLAARFRSEVNGSAVVVKTGAMGRMNQL